MVHRGIFGCSKIYSMGGERGVSAEERRKSLNVRRLSRFNFLLPHIDTLVDNTTKFALFSFMDGFSGYNQIRMTLADLEKTNFITLWGTFCYKVMPCGLKNTGARYQRAMVPYSMT